MNPETIKIDNVVYTKVGTQKTATALWEGGPSPFEIGEIYLIRTVTMIDVGRVVAASHKWIVLEDAAWIADTGRFSDALKSCEFSEVEPFPDGHVIIGAGAVIDAVKIARTTRVKK